MICAANKGVTEYRSYRSYRIQDLQNTGVAKYRSSEYKFTL
jgi:hypothetical protein